MSDDWSDLSFLSYVDIHSRTELALFSIEHVKRFFSMAGLDSSKVPNDGFYPMPYEKISTLLIRQMEIVSTQSRLKDKLNEQASEIWRLKELINRDRTGLALGLNTVIQIAKGFDWICEGRGPYEYDDDRYRMEVGSLITKVIDTADKCLFASGERANEAFHPRAQKTNEMFLELCK